MSVYLGKRLLQLLPILLGMSIGVFLLVHFIPGDPAITILGEDYSEARAAVVREELGLDRPLPVQFGIWLGNVLRGDLGRSLFNNALVTNLLLARGTVTLTLAIVTTLFSLAIAIPMGVFSATHRDSWLDNLLRIVSIVGISMPVFWFGLLLMLLFSLQLGLLPPGGSPSTLGYRAYILPALTLGIYNAALVTRMTRSAMLEVLEQDYIRTARAKGINERLIQYKHAFRNALIPVVTIVGLQFGNLLSGTVLTEFIFSLPGLGSLLIDSVYRRDFPIVQGAVLLTGIAFVITNLVVDMLYAALDPRIRY